MKIYNTHKPTHTSARQFPRRKPEFKKQFKSNNLFLSITKIFNKIDENPFLFQIIGISILTLAILISFQSLADFSVTPVNASTYEVRMLTNFQAVQEQEQFSSSKIEEIQLSKPELVALEKIKILTYEVKSGDTLSGISNQIGVSVSDLINFNNIESSSDLKIGQILQLSK
jgi:LysM repeat protein